MTASQRNSHDVREWFPLLRNSVYTVIATGVDGAGSFAWTLEKRDPKGIAALRIRSRDHVTHERASVFRLWLVSVENRSTLSIGANL